MRSADDAVDQSLKAPERRAIVVLGPALGYFAFFMLRGVDSYAVEIIISLTLATGGSSLAENLHLSAPITVVVEGLVIGNHGEERDERDHTPEPVSFWDLITRC